MQIAAARVGFAHLRMRACSAATALAAVSSATSSLQARAGNAGDTGSLQCGNVICIERVTLLQLAAVDSQRVGKHDAERVIVVAGKFAELDWRRRVERQIDTICHNGRMVKPVLGVSLRRGWQGA